MTSDQLREMHAKLFAPHYDAPRFVFNKATGEFEKADLPTGNQSINPEYVTSPDATVTYDFSAVMPHKRKTPPSKIHE